VCGAEHRPVATEGDRQVQRLVEEVGIWAIDRGILEYLMSELLEEGADLSRNFASQGSLGMQN
jgi:hypothetical protein